MNILLLGGGLQGLSFGESLYKKGYEVDVVSNNLHIKKSVFFKKVYSKGYNSTDESVINILKRYKYDIIIPMGDMNVSFLTRHKKRIESEYHTKCACPTIEKLEMVEDKKVFMKFCKDNNIPHPLTFEICDGNYAEAASYVGFPALIKPNYSVGARGITLVNSLQELKDCYPTIIENYGDCTLQEFIENKDYYYNVMIYRSCDGDILASAIIKIVRMYPVKAGSSSCCISEENTELLELCINCLEKLDWTGMADFDVLQRPDNGEYKIIEINPRVPASLRGAFVSGVNFPEIIIKDLMNEKIPSYKFEGGKTLRFMGLDIMWFLHSDRRFNTRPSWFRFFGKNIYYQDICLNDSSTWWTWLAEGILKIRKREKRLR